MTDNNNNESINILVDVNGVYKIDGDYSTYILDSFSYESDEPFPIICEISEEYAEIAKKYFDKQLTIQLITYNLSKPDIYADEEEFENDKTVFVQSQSFLASPQTIVNDKEEIPIPEAMITGVVRNVSGPYKFQDEYESFDYYEIGIDLFGISIIALFKKVDLPDIQYIVPGNIISCTYYLCGELYSSMNKWLTLFETMK